MDATTQMILDNNLRVMMVQSQMSASASASTSCQTVSGAGDEAPVLFLVWFFAVLLILLFIGIRQEYEFRKELKKDWYREE